MDGRTALRAQDTRAYLLFAVAFGLLATAATVAQAILLGGVVAGVMTSGGSDDRLGTLLSLLLCAVLARSIFVWLREVVALWGAVRAKQGARDRLVGHLFALGPAYFSGRSSGGLVTTAVEGVEKLEAYFARYLPQAYLSVIAPVLVAACVLWLDLLSGIVLLATGPAIPVLMVLIGKQAESRTRLQLDELSRMGSSFLDALRGLETLKAFGRAKTGLEAVTKASDEFGRRTMKVLRVAFFSGFALEFIATVSVALVAVLLAVRLLFGDLALAVALPVLLLAPEFYRPLRDLAASRHAGMEGQAAAERMDEILGIPLSSAGDKGPARDHRRPLTVELSELGFSHPGGKRPTLSGIDLVLPAGTRTALVGASGAGKSTLVDLLMRFREPDEGRILADGKPIARLAPEAWRERVALVPQRPHLFHGSVLENLRLARPDATSEEVARAAKLAGADGFVRRLPHSYDTQVGERGARLSEGEVQRLAIARALLRDTPLLVMDEPASNLDPESERLVGGALERIGDKRTVLVVAHRLGTARNADRIAVLEEGNLAEIGTHGGLIAAGGPYARLVEAAGHPEPDVGVLPASSDKARRAPDPKIDPTGPSQQKSGPTNGGGLLRLLGFLWPYRGRAALAAALGAWTTAANVGLLAASAYLVSAASLKPPLGDLILVAILVQVLGTSRGVSRYFERLLSHEATFGLLAGLRAWLYARLIPLSPARLVTRRGGEMLSRMVDDVGEMQNVYLGAIVPVVGAALVSALGFVILYAFAPAPAFATLVLLALSGLGVPLLMGALERALGRRPVALKAAIAADLAEGIHGMRDLVAFGREKERARVVQDLGAALARAQGRAAFATGLREGLQELCGGLALWATLALAAPLALGGRIGGVYLALLALTALASFEAVRPLGEAIQTAGRSGAAGRRIFEIADSEPAVTDPEEPLATPSGRALRLDRVTFRYGEREPLALQDVSFSIEVGEKVALVGPSGSGKSTLTNLLLRFWDPTSGVISLDGEDLRRYAQEDVRGILSVAAQGAHIFDGTLRENLLLAKPEATEDELWSALGKAQLEVFAGSLPDGLDTAVGESGARLSGGEKRRLAAARAFLKDAPFLVFDEPTADLDAETERRFVDALHEHADGRGLLLITHRLVGMERMDEILVLQDGRIDERGTHGDVVAAGGLYARMFGVQERMLTGR